MTSADPSGAPAAPRARPVLGAVVGLVFVAAIAFAAIVAVRRARRVDVKVVVGAVAAPEVASRSQLCADVGDERVCWGEASGARGASECRDGACIVPRPLPQGPTPSMGWRCGGAGATRVCADRQYNASAFACSAVGSCVQPDPRMPDDNEWECVELEGVAYCHATAEASAVVPGPPDLGWTCGRRRGGRERICVDLSPDRPDGRSWRCTFQYKDFYPTRTCVRSDAPSVGGACTGDGRGNQGACPVDASCVAGTCVPRKPAPDCWIDADCGEAGRCRWGTCTGGGA